MILGTDGSQFAGVPDLVALAPTFHIPRGSSGLEHVDTLVEAHLLEAERARVQVPADYHYVSSIRSGARQAEHAFRTMRTLGLDACFADFEPVREGTRPEDAPHLARVVAHDFLRRWQDLAGRPCGVYGPVDYLAQLNLDAELCGPLWAAHVGPLVPRVPRPFSGYVLHQYEHNAYGGRPGTAVDWNRTELTLEQLVAVLRGEPLGYDVLGPVVQATREAMGRGERVEDFKSRDEGP